MSSSMSTTRLLALATGPLAATGNGAIELKIASLTRFTCSSRSLTFIWRSALRSRSFSSSFSRCSSFTFLFCRHRFDARLLRSRMRRYLKSLELEEASLGLKGASLSLDLRRLALKRAGKEVLNLSPIL